MKNKEMNKPASRRDWFTGPAALLGAGAVASILARAQSTCGAQGEAGCFGASASDINLLNFALKMENLESAFYQQGLGMFTSADFENSVTVQTMGGTKIGASLYSYLGAIAQTEQNHASAVFQTIVSLDGAPVPVGCYNFGITTTDSFLQIAQVIENTKVMAYGAIAAIQNPSAQTQAATIATVDARHAAYFNLLNLALPFPGPFDTTQTMSQIVSAIGPFLTTGCNPKPVQLTLAFAGPAKDSIITTNQNTVQLNASLSTSATGTPLTYLWNQDLGSPLMEIINPSSEIATAILLGGAGEYSIALRVTDSLGNTDQDTLKIIYQP